MITTLTETVRSHSLKYQWPKKYKTASYMSCGISYTITEVPDTYYAYM